MAFTSNNLFRAQLAYIKIVVLPTGDELAFDTVSIDTVVPMDTVPMDSIPMDSIPMYVIPMPTILTASGHNCYLT